MYFSCVAIFVRLFHHILSLTFAKFNSKALDFINVVLSEQIFELDESNQNPNVIYGTIKLSNLQ